MKASGMTHERWLGVRELLPALKDLPVEEKERRIREAYPVDAEFRREVVELQQRCELSTQWLTATDTWPDTPEDTPGPVPGDMCGPYRIKYQIGAGGMGRVFLAEDTLLPREVALKTLRAEIDTPRARTRIRDEAARQAELHGHPHIAKLLHVVETEKTGLPVLVMEYVEGTAASVQLENGPVREKRVLKWAHQVASAIDHAHNRGILHCDLKPGNIQITTNDDAKVLDFGLARAVRSSTPGPVGGTLPYMAPEQVVGGSFSEASDLYSFGVTLFELMTGQCPFPVRSREEREQLVHEILGCPPPNATSVVPGLPPAIDAVLARAMAKDPRQRHRTARELVDELNRVFDVPAPQPAPPPKPTDRLAVVLAFLSVLTLMGFITSLALDSGLGRIGEFNVESPLWWPVYGLRMLIAPVVTFGIWLVGFYVFWSLCRVAYRIQPVRRLLAPVVSPIGAIAGRIQRSPNAVLTPVLLATQVSALVLLIWSFYPLLRALVAFLDPFEPGALHLLSPGNLLLHDSYRLYSSLDLFGFSAVWYWLIRRSGREGHGVVPLGGKIVGVTLTVLTLFVYSLPYRPLRKNDFPAVSYGSETCYLTARQGEEALVFCPFRLPRTHIAKISGLERTGTSENIFTTFDDSK